MGKYCILIVTDGLEEYVWLPSYFIAKGFDVFAVSRDEAVGVINKYLPDAILLNSPYGDTWENWWLNCNDPIWFEIRSTASTRHIPFIFFVNPGNSLEDLYKYGIPDLWIEEKSWIDPSGRHLTIKRIR